MKKLATALVSVAATAALLPGVAGAADVTTGEDSVMEITVPEECFTEVLDVGPARAAHSPAGEEVVLVGPCEGIEGLCVTVVYPAGPSRAAHRPSGDTTEVPCTPLGPACDLEVRLADRGPARAAHATAVHPAGKGSDEIIIDIPQECQDLLSAALIPQSGSDSGTILWLGALLVVVGGALLFTRRTVVARTR